jgi:DNA-binding transcriptional LysR family regulator
MDIPWNDVRLFLAVAELGSLSAAARRLNVGQPTVSRRLAELEEQLGYPLFDRSVEGTKLTARAERLLEPARRMAEWAAELQRAADRGEPGPRGVVRITAPPGVAYDLLAPFAASLQETLPEVTLQVLSRVEYLDLGRREADLALRLRAPTQRDLVVVERIEHPNDAFVARSSLARLPPRPGLADIGFIAWAPPFEGLSPNPELAAMIPGFRPAFASDDFIVQLAAAEAGAGAIFLGNLRHRFARTTSLVPLGLDLGPHASSSLHLVSTRSALELPRVRAVAELLSAELRAAVQGLGHGAARSPPQGGLGGGHPGDGHAER